MSVQNYQLRIGCQTCPEAWVEFTLELSGNGKPPIIRNKAGRFPINAANTELLGGSKKVGYLMIRPEENISVQIQKVDPEEDEL